MATAKPLHLRVIGHNVRMSMDGMDTVHVEFTQETPSVPLHCKFLRYGEVEMPKSLEKKVMHLIKTNSTPPEEISVRFEEEQGVQLQKEVDVIAGQGQTIWHLLLSDLFPGRDVSRAHLNMAEICTIAAETGITTLGNFRVSDFSLRKQGCPLFAAFDNLWVNHATKTRAVQKIGGTVNFSISMAGGDAMRCFDLDTGPGNFFNDATVQYFTSGEREFDEYGEIGAKGTVNQAVVDEWLDCSIRRQTFGDDTADRIRKRMIEEGATPEDCVATITNITAQSLAEHYKRYAPDPLDEVFMGGGGSRNPNIVKHLREQLPKTHITTIDELGVPLEAKEALGFAFLDCEGFVGRPVMVPLHLKVGEMVLLGIIITSG
ncbi:UPF0075-domain-containing protein [Saccharata proteae CBS 121410]|uniref:UPF0075-domain-containing protein n=1 Tax=Saccharata proteae CBS 121410 TaxID=1314787 RepID=A0A9P4LT74_9PEZI|nr:UPF0075-domain-containing protein [Saccharata proteae CBS 121410]